MNKQTCHCPDFHHSVAWIIRLHTIPCVDSNSNECQRIPASPLRAAWLASLASHARIGREDFKLWKFHSKYVWIFAPAARAGMVVARRGGRQSTGISNCQSKWLSARRTNERSPSMGPRNTERQQVFCPGCIHIPQEIAIRIPPPLLSVYLAAYVIVCMCECQLFSEQ